MIWTNGKILPDDGLSISVLDRTFEHGLGLFETLRTWGGRPTLLEEHKARMLRSAAELKLPIDPASLPDAEAVRRLLEAEAVEGDRMLRITASGGTASEHSVVWMRSSPLPAPIGEGGATLLLNAWKVSADDPMARHKSLNYWSRRLAYEEALRRGCDEALSEIPEDQEYGTYHVGYLEGSRTSLFGVASGEGLLSWMFKKQPALVITPSTRKPIVAGVMRGEVLKVVGELTGELQILYDVDNLTLSYLSEVFLTNSVRGIIPVARAVISNSGAERYRWPSPGPWTTRLQELVARRLWPDRGETP